MGEPNLIRRASRRCVSSVRRSLSREDYGSDDKSCLSQRSQQSTSRSLFSISISSLCTTTTVEEDELECSPRNETLPESPTRKPSCSDQQAQKHTIVRILPKFRRQIKRRHQRNPTLENKSILSLLGKTIIANENKQRPQDKPIFETLQKKIPRYDQGQSHFFRRLPPEIRKQIYEEFWVASGVERHVFVRQGSLFYSPCITNHEAADERQQGLAGEFAPSPEAQGHPVWFKRLKSKWCNHWKCEELWHDICDGKEVDYNHGQNQGFMSLLLSCKRIYDESIESFQQHKIINITDGSTLLNIIKYPRPKYLTDARIINISLREDSGNWLYLNGASVWHFLSEQEIKAERVYVWLDAECPVTRRLLPEFRDLYLKIPAAVADRLTIDFPCDAPEGFWAWGEVQVRTQSCGDRNSGEVIKMEAFVPGFKVVARGRPRFNEMEFDYVSSQDKGRPRVRVLGAGNPFEDILLYGRGVFDESYD